jgi:hypothetical protein
MSEEYEIPEGWQGKTFESMDEFATFLSESGLFILDQRVTTFYDAYMGINRGCKCGRNKRLQHTVTAYRDLTDMVLGAKAAIRQALDGNYVIKHEGSVILLY